MSAGLPSLRALEGNTQTGLPGMQVLAKFFDRRNIKGIEDLLPWNVAGKPFPGLQRAAESCLNTTLRRSPSLCPDQILLDTQIGRLSLVENEADAFGPPVMLTNLLRRLFMIPCLSSPDRADQFGQASRIDVTHSDHFEIIRVSVDYVEP
jgi:hypothetical protein